MGFSTEMYTDKLNCKMECEKCHTRIFHRFSIPADHVVCRYCGSYYAFLEPNHLILPAFTPFNSKFDGSPCIKCEFAVNDIHLCPFGIVVKKEDECDSLKGEGWVKKWAKENPERWECLKGEFEKDYTNNIPSPVRMLPVEDKKLPVDKKEIKYYDPHSGWYVTRKVNLDEGYCEKCHQVFKLNAKGGNGRLCDSCTAKELQIESSYY